jgi:diguanylate cyclase (GGDEF)-like protein/PAS domain S-box-containing protein
MHNKIRILIIADDHAYDDKLMEILSDNDYIPTMAKLNGNDVDALVTAENPALVLIDLSETNSLDGIDMGRKIRTGFNLPLIFLASRSDQELFNRTFTNNPFAYVLKPYDPEGLYYTIEIALARHRFEENLIKSEQHFRSIFDASAGALMVVGKNGLIEMVNEEFIDLSGYTQSEVIDKKYWSELLIGAQLVKRKEKLNLKYSDPRILPSEFQAVLTGKNFRAKFVLARMKKTSSERRILSIMDISRFKRTEDEILKLNKELNRVNGVLRKEIGEREQMEKQLKHQATHDFLTGLPTRELMFDRLHQALAFEGRHTNNLMALMVLDLDDFKMVNDTLGHMCGDILLKEVATRLNHCMRKYDTVARLGGDEFVIICNNMPNNESIVKFAEKVQAVFQVPFQIFDQHQKVTASIGIATFPFHGTTSDALLNKADRAMYEAKKNRNSVCLYSNVLDALDTRQSEMVAQLQGALDRDEFFPHYQPRINTATGRITGMEALMRWKPEGATLVHPSEFIDTLEQTGLILPVGERFLQQICRQNKTWQEAGIPPLRVAVKVSEKQFRQKDLPLVVEQALSETGLDPRYLELELPEDMVMSNIADSAQQIELLKRVGVSLSLDNFGTGYTSLSYLNKLQVDELKIDRSLINGITTNDSNAAIVSATIAMGHNIGKKIVAQGVESQKQLLFLSQQQCEGVQGYLFYRPLPSSVFENVVRQFFMANGHERGGTGSPTIN